MKTSQIEQAQQTIEQAAASIESFDRLITRMEAEEHEEFIPNVDYYEIYVQLAKVKNMTEGLVERFHYLRKCVITE